MENYYIKKYKKYKKKYFNLKKQIGGVHHNTYNSGESEKYNVCTKIVGLEQTDSTCWFDSIMMALLIPTNMANLWEPVLKKYFDLTLQKLLDDTISTGFQERKKWLLKYGGTEGIPNNIFTNGFPRNLLQLLINNGLSNIEYGETPLKYEYNDKTHINSIIESEILSDVIPDISIKFKSSPMFFAYLYNSSIFPRSQSILITQKYKSTDDSEYTLQSIVMVHNQHIISYVLCKYEWYVYDNERAARA